MRLPHLGEGDVIRHLSELFSVHGSEGCLIGIGDDCAVIPSVSSPGRGEMAWLVTADALVEGVHFLKDQISADDLGYKTVAVSVSDVIAMGGEPKYAFLSLALPKDCLAAEAIDGTWVGGVLQGIREACEKWGILLLGGDTVGSKRDVFLNLTLIGSATISEIKYRHTAQPGDIICVSGFLGDSGGGLRVLSQRIAGIGADNSDVEYLLSAHFHPEPKLEQGRWLAAEKDVHAMMDLSDGLDSDLKKLLASSQKGACIETTQLPLSVPLTRISLEKGWDPLELALIGGEDYCLLLTVSANAFDSLQQAFQSRFEHPLFAIGHITDQTGELMYQRRGAAIQAAYTSFDHFQNQRSLSTTPP